MAINRTPNGIIITDDADPAREPLVLPLSATTAEVEAAAQGYLTPPPPEADWLGFVGWLYGFPPIAAAMAAARLSTDPQGEPATSGLATALNEARLSANYPAFALSWGMFLQASHMAPADLAAIVTKAADCNLPTEFIEALQPQQPSS
jgi:hypothetical protein